MNLDLLLLRLQKFRRGLILVLCGGCLWLGLALSTNLVDLRHAAVWAQTNFPTLDSRTQEQEIGLDSVRQSIRGRAVFRSSRVRPPKIVDDSGRFIMTGTAIRDGVPSAYIKDTKTKKLHTLREGDYLGGVFKVIRIGEGTVELERGNDIITLEK